MNLNRFVSTDVFWYKDTVHVTDLADDERCDVTLSGDKRVTCHMYDVRASDQGQYLCIAVNECGRCSRAFKLKVVGTNRRPFVCLVFPPKLTKNPMAVVCSCRLYNYVTCI